MMIEVFMNREEATRLSDLLKEIRGDQTVRSFCFCCSTVSCLEYSRTAL